MQLVLSVCIFIVTIFQNGYALRAPDVAPELPEGWCDARYGSATKTTGECICLTAECEGRGCEKEQGFVWYSYSKCPACRCVAKNSRLSTGKHAEDQTDEGQRKHYAEFEVHMEEVIAANVDASDSNFESSWVVLEFLEQYGRFLFAVVVGIILMSLFAVFLMVRSSSTESNSAHKCGTNR